MYGLVPYNISPIQQGIQFGHAVVEYGLKYFNEPEYQAWATEHKTFIILNGGTTNDSIDPESGVPTGTLNQYADYLEKFLKLPIARFYEPDLGDQLTAVVFIVNEYCFDKELYPDSDPVGYPINWPSEIQGAEEFGKILNIRDFLRRLKLA